jgi:hypothetical protein
MLLLAPAAVQLAADVMRTWYVLELMGLDNVTVVLGTTNSPAACDPTLDT